MTDTSGPQPDQSDHLRVVVATPLRQELADRIAATDERVEVVLDHDLLPPMRYPADHSGDPAFERTPEQQQRFEELLLGADVLYGIPGGDSDLLRRVVEGNDRLRWVQTMAAGGGAQVTAAHLTDEQLDRVAFTTSAGVHGVPLAEFALLGILAGANDLAGLQRDQRAHEWPTLRTPGRSVEGSTVLVVGLGGIGVEVARRCQALGMRVLGVKRTPEPIEHVDEVHATDDLPEIIGRADVIVVTLPGTTQTEGLLSADLLARAQRGVTLVNVGRGTVVDEPALVEALRSGQVGYAALDVFATEPLPADSPLWDLDTVLVSPHTAALDVREEERIADLFVDNLHRFLDGRPLRNVVDPEFGY